MSNHKSRQCEVGAHTLILDGPVRPMVGQGCHHAQGRGDPENREKLALQGWWESLPDRGGEAGVNIHIQATGSRLHRMRLEVCLALGRFLPLSSHSLNLVFLCIHGRSLGPGGELGRGERGARELSPSAGEPSDNRKQLQQVPGLCWCLSLSFYPGCSPCRTNCSSRSSGDRGPTPAPQVGLDKPGAQQRRTMAQQPPSSPPCLRQCNTKQELQEENRC